MKTVQVRFTLEEINEWSKASTGISLDTFKGNVEAFIRISQQVPSFRLQSRMRPLIVDEAIDPEDIVIIVVDEETGEEHYYNPPMDDIFAGLTPKPYLNSV